MGLNKKLSDPGLAKRGLQACFARTAENVMVLEDGNFPWSGELKKYDLEQFWELAGEGSSAPLILVMGTRTAESMLKIKPHHPRVIIGSSAEKKFPASQFPHWQCFPDPQTWVETVKDPSKYLIAAGPKLLSWFLEKNLIYRCRETVFHLISNFSRLKRAVIQETQVGKLDYGFVDNPKWHLEKHSIRVGKCSGDEEDSSEIETESTARSLLYPKALDHAVINDWVYISEEGQLIQVLKDIHETGYQEMNGRILVGTRSIKGCHLVFDLSGGIFPLPTYRPHGIVQPYYELLWMLSGSTWVPDLSCKGVKVWDGQSSQEWLAKNNLDYPEGELGPSYGFNWRHFEGEFIPGTSELGSDGSLLSSTLMASLRVSSSETVDSKKDENSQVSSTTSMASTASFNSSGPIVCSSRHEIGLDQLTLLVRTLLSQPASRRMVVSLWSARTSQMALPPCLWAYEFSVEGDVLSVTAIQRSSDIFLAGGWNITTIALLVYTLAAATGLKPGKIYWDINDAHMYLNQEKMVQEALSRTVSTFPHLEILRDSPSLDGSLDENTNKAVQWILSMEPRKSVRLWAYWPDAPLSEKIPFNL